MWTEIHSQDALFFVTICFYLIILFFINTQIILDKLF
jgi:hypothetical protein